MKIFLTQDVSKQDRKGRHPTNQAFYIQKGSNSKYTPHIGAKEQKKAGIRYNSLFLV